MEEIKNEILKAGKVTSEIKKKYFFENSFELIRDKLDKLGIDRHMPIELESTEIAILTPNGILMQIRPLDKNQLGLWGGALNDGEEPKDGAVRELFEETRIKINKEQLEFLEIHEHFHEYSNKDKAYFKSYRYLVRFNTVPKIITDSESVGTCIVSHTILNHQQDLIKRLLGEKE